MSAQLPCPALDTLRKRLGDMRAAKMTWRAIAAEFRPVPPGTLCAIYKGRAPKKLSYRRALGLVPPRVRRPSRRAVALQLLGGLWGGRIL